MFKKFCEVIVCALALVGLAFAGFIAFVLWKGFIL
jgi:hypothetical protein